MVTIKTNLVKELRERTHAGMMDCKKALAESKGDIDRAIKYLREKGLVKAQKKSGRATAQGAVEAYIHMHGKIGVLVEINCETDFVAKTDEFKKLLKDIAMHIAAANPQYVKREDIPVKLVEAEKEILKAQLKEEKNKPAEVLEKIINGKLDKYYKEACLEEQPFVKDTEKTIKDVINEAIAKLGENITINRFARFQRGE